MGAARVGLTLTKAPPWGCPWAAGCRLLCCWHLPVPDLWAEWAAVPPPGGRPGHRGRCLDSGPFFVALLLPGPGRDARRGVARWPSVRKPDAQPLPSRCGGQRHLGAQHGPPLPVGSSAGPRGPRGQVSRPSPGWEAGHAGGGSCPWLVASLCLGANRSETVH